MLQPMTHILNNQHGILWWIFGSCWAWKILLPSRSIKFDKLSKGAGITNLTAKKHLVKSGENCPRWNLVVHGNPHSNRLQVVLAEFLNNQQVCFFSPKTQRNSQKLLTNRKSSSLFAILWKRPPTRAARWITWVGLCFWKIASVALRSTKSPSLEERKIQVSLFDASSSFTTWTRKNLSPLQNMKAEIDQKHEVSVFLLIFRQFLTFRTLATLEKLQQFHMDLLWISSILYKTMSTKNTQTQHFYGFKPRETSSFF